MAISDFAPPVWLRVGNKVDWKGLTLTIKEIKEVPSDQRYWAERGQTDLLIVFEESREKRGWHGLKKL